ncbi:MAG TPA: hypothetical protein VFE37_17090 [Chloroflexota bacterium]|nr:hypothetical protein [Chloroflexota bacterium]
MRELWLVDRARDRLIVTAAMMEQLHDKLRFGLAQPDQAETASAVILAQVQHAIALVEEASQGLRCAPEELPAGIPAPEEASAKLESVAAAAAP